MRNRVEVAVLAEGAGLLRCGRVRVLDGLYVALAEKRHSPLLTTDLRLLRGEPPCEVLAPTA